MSNQSPTKRYKNYPQSTCFTRETSPTRFRHTFVSSGSTNLSTIGQLRHTFQPCSIQAFEEYCQKNFKQKQDRQQTYKNLKNTLTDLEERIRKVNVSLVEKKFIKTKNIKLNQQYQLQQKQDKNRQTVSTTITTNFYQTQPKIFPFITSQPKPLNFHPFITNPYDKISNNYYYISEALRAVNEKNSLAVEHINGSIKMLQSCKGYSLEEYWPRSIIGFEMKRLDRDQSKKKTLILDLDETLIHSYENSWNETDLCLSMTIEGTKVKVGVNIRPYAITFLKRMAKKYEIVIFTASHQSYANAILDQLDPQGAIFSHRFYREHCTLLPNSLHVKDLRYLQRNLKDMVLVDNAAYSYAFQLQNGIPILPYYEGKDFELAALEKYLDRLAECQDVRQMNRECFKLSEYTKFENAEQIIGQLYEQKHKKQQ